MGKFVIAAVFSCVSGVAAAQSFDLSGQQLQMKFNALSLKQNGDTIRKCIPLGDGLVGCVYNDAKFRVSVDAFKKMNLANGRFDLTETLGYKEEKGKVVRVSMTGTRADPMNLFHFWGDVGGMMSVLDSTLDDDTVKKDMLDLGMMGGDSDPYIGSPKTVFHTGFAAACTMENSKVSTDVQCVFDPRY